MIFSLEGGGEAAGKSVILHAAAEAEADIFPDAWSEKTLEGSFRYDCYRLLYLPEGCENAEEKPEEIPDRKEITFAGYLIYTLTAGDAELCRIGVRKMHRGKGLGDALMHRMMEELRRRNAERLSLEVRVSNTAALRLYEKYGLKTIYIRKKYYRDPEEDAAVMQITGFGNPVATERDGK